MELRNDGRRKKKKIRMLEDKVDAFRDRQMEIATFWNRKKLWSK